MNYILGCTDLSGLRGSTNTSLIQKGQTKIEPFFFLDHSKIKRLLSFAILGIWALTRSLQSTLFGVLGDRTDKQKKHTGIATNRLGTYRLGTGSVKMLI